MVSAVFVTDGVRFVLFTLRLPVMVSSNSKHDAIALIFISSTVGT